MHRGELAFSYAQKIIVYCVGKRAYQEALVVKTYLPVQEMQGTVWSLGGEDSLEEVMATHSSILAWRIPWTEEPAGYSP